MPTEVKAHITTVVAIIPDEVEMGSFVKTFAIDTARRHYTTNRDTLMPNAYYSLPVGRWERKDRTIIGQILYYDGLIPKKGKLCPKQSIA